MNVNILLTSRLFMLATALCMTLTGCDDWLDVRPKSEIPTDLHFDRESGFKDQLTGVYTQMTTTGMYGQDMSFGLVSCLSQDYDLRNNSIYQYAIAYNYKESTTQSRINAIWSKTYNCIANLNVMLQYIDEVSPNIFSDNNHDLYKGEALGLRAFLHFDLLRMFSPAPSSNANANAIPYVTEYDKVITSQKTVSETIDLIIRDLEEASELLKVDIYLDKENYTYSERWARRVYFNYYASIATLARVYLYKGDKENALRYANIIIEEGEDSKNSNFSWVHYTSVETTNERNSDRLFSTEHIFRLTINGFDDIVKYYFTSASGSNALTPSDEKADEIFERTSKGYGNDYRMLKGFAYDGENKYLWKYHQYEGGAYTEMLPLIRKSEAYYIAAEILKDSDPEEAVRLLNLVRTARNLSLFPLNSDNLTVEEIQEEIKKEYRKEFLAEGQMFYYYKRLNLPYIEGAGISASDNIYVLPMPDDEIEFGNRN